MAHHKSAKKRIRSDEKKRARNHSYISSVRTAIKSLKDAVQDPDSQPQGLKPLLEKAQSLLGKAAAKGIIHKNTASRKISRLVKSTEKTGKEIPVKAKKTSKKVTKKKASKTKAKKKK